MSRLGGVRWWSCPLRLPLPQDALARPAQKLFWPSVGAFEATCYILLPSVTCGYLLLPFLPFRPAAQCWSNAGGVEHCRAKCRRTSSPSGCVAPERVMLQVPARPGWSKFFPIWANYWPAAPGIWLMMHNNSCVLHLTAEKSPVRQVPAKPAKKRRAKATIQGCVARATSVPPLHKQTQCHNQCRHV